MKNVFIIGSRGYHFNYGGWETFVSNLVDNYNDKETIFHIATITTKKEEKEIKINDNILVNPIYVSIKGSPAMFLFSVKSFFFYLKYVKKNDLSKSYFYILGLKLANFLGMTKNILKRYNIITLVNPDGLEHKRGKWNYLVKKFFLFSEKSMLKNSDKIICDAIGIKEYIDTTYPKLKNKTTYIAYGANSIKFTDEFKNETLKEYNLLDGNYLLMVGRCVPENNYVLVIKEFLKSSINKELVIISNISNGNYYNKLIKETNCLSDKRIRFIDGVYDNKKLAVIRKCAYLYIHGHSVGGTNPSLLEALSLTDLNILYDVNFNHDIGSSSCLYFKEENSLKELLDNKEYLDSQKEQLGKKAKKIIQNNFTWDIIVKKYKKIFK